MKPSDNNWKRQQQKANKNLFPSGSNNNNAINNAINNNNNKVNLTNYRKPAILNNNNNNNNRSNINNLPDVSWDEIESRDADSIRSDSDQASFINKNKKKQNKLYTFYDYIGNKNKVANNNQQGQQLQPQQQQQQQQQQQPYQQFDESANEESAFWSNSESQFPQNYYVTMPISSGFGGYTNTTRRKVPPKVYITLSLSLTIFLF